MIDRRAFIAGVAGGLMADPLAVYAQQAKVPVIGFLNGFSPAEWTQPLGGFRKGLSDAGFVEGKDVVVEYRWAEGRFDRLPALAADLVRRQVAVLVATGGSITAVKAHAATTTVPIVFGIGTDPAKLGLVATLNRPGGNATGVYFLTGELEGKRLGILRELVPNAALIGVLLNPNLPNADERMKAAQAAATAVGQRIHIARATSEPEIEGAFATLAQMHVAALQIGADPFFLTRRGAIVALAARHGIPAIYEQREFAEAGGLMSYGTSLNDAWREAGVYVGRILKGEKPADMPVTQSTKFEFVINLRTAKAMRLSIPQSLSLRADDVIQ